MGYTHYVTIPEDTYEAALAAIPKVARDLRRLYEAGALPPLAGPRGYGEPEFGNHKIEFNGVRPNDADPFCIGPKPCQGKRTRYFSVKTSIKPYDLAVMVAFALWWRHSSAAVMVDSASSPKHWAAALALLEGELGYVIDVQKFFDLSYAHLRFDGGLEIVLELKHRSANLGELNRKWLLHTLHLLSVKTYAKRYALLNDNILASLQEEDLSHWPTLLYHGRDPVPGFGSHRFGGILFADAKTTREKT